ncbi:MAG TPA: aspartate carbamoyltransferase regulatory subunit [Bacteroidales bacterium]|nr:aspartate carbamoyltransferase regulatory subunit [Bacteroidales bacterium]HPS18247.1 aspartate carbamoyltransferase regulatory subunit [Bacteroidales bacterium]
MTTPRKEYKVSAIENGTVIDHIPPKSVYQVIKILHLEESNDMMLFGTNLESKKYGKKGIVKVSNKFFKKNEINKIGLVAPNATLIVIKDYQVVSKEVVKLPDTIEDIVKCFNPNCITNHEKVKTKFYFIDKEDVKLRCHYCEKITDKKNMVVR